MAHPIIYRSEYNKMYLYSLKTFYTSYERYKDELKNQLPYIHYFNKHEPSEDYPDMHAYISEIDETLGYIWGYKFIIINAIFHKVTKNALYLDYLYYKDVINYSNNVISINRRYFIDVGKIGILEKNKELKVGMFVLKANKKVYLKEDAYKKIYMQYFLCK
ncbi:MAG: hypothetical protein IRZ03_18945 [Acidobacterium ailaaui]|nr:hypothetical protein [Pseudacidobacterium ailaaui]